MYCKYCGNQLSDDALFCDKCGKSTNETAQIGTTPTAAQKNTGSAVGRTDTGDIGQFIVQAKYNTRSGAALFVGDVLDLILGIILVSVASGMKHYDKMYENKDLFSTLGIICIITGVIGFILSVYIVSVNSRIFCSVYENRVIGTFAESRWSSRTVDLELPYDQINSVSSNKRIVTIFANGRTYYAAAFDMNMAERVVGAIEERMTDTSAPAHNKNQRWECKDCGMINSAAMTVCQSCGSLKFYGKVIDETERKPTENEWKCPTCGRINQNYVGTCGCGTPKP